MILQNESNSSDGDGVIMDIMGRCPCCRQECDALVCVTASASGSVAVAGTSSSVTATARMDILNELVDHLREPPAVGVTEVFVYVFDAERGNGYYLIE